MHSSKVLAGTTIEPAGLSVLAYTVQALVVCHVCYDTIQFWHQSLRSWACCPAYPGSRYQSRCGYGPAHHQTMPVNKVAYGPAHYSVVVTLRHNRAFAGVIRHSTELKRSHLLNYRSIYQGIVCRLNGAVVRLERSVVTAVGGAFRRKNHLVQSFNGIGIRRIRLYGTVAFPPIPSYRLGPASSSLQACSTITAMTNIASSVYSFFMLGELSKRFM